jgi:8-oxo-dGTP diphosphatase
VIDSPGDWLSVPVFGKPPDSSPPTRRPSAYALIANGAGRVAIVRSIDGIYLPGGGIEAGETVEAAIRREAREECGFDVRAGEWSLRAVQFSYSPSSRADFEKLSTFRECVILGGSGAPSEPGHELIWAEPAEAAALLTHESHGWAVKEWISGGGGRR